MHSQLRLKEFCCSAKRDAEGAAFPTATRAMSSWTPARSCGFAQGITHSFARLGNAITPTIMAALLLFVSWRGSFVVLGLLSLVWLFVWVWYFRNDPGDHPAITEAESVWMRDLLKGRFSHS